MVEPSLKPSCYTALTRPQSVKKTDIEQLQVCLMLFRGMKWNRRLGEGGVFKTERFKLKIIDDTLTYFFSLSWLQTFEWKKATGNPQGVWERKYLYLFNFLILFKLSRGLPLFQLLLTIFL